MQQLRTPLFAIGLAALLCVSTPLSAKGAPAHLPSQNPPPQTATTSTWMLVYQISYYNVEKLPTIHHIADISSDKECERVWKDISPLIDPKVYRKHKCIPVEKRSR